MTLCFLFGVLELMEKERFGDGDSRLGKRGMDLLCNLHDG